MVYQLLKLFQVNEDSYVRLLWEMKRSGRNHERNPNWGSISLIISIEKKKTSPRLVKQVLQRPQERNKGHLMLWRWRRGKGRRTESQPPRPKNKPIVVLEIVGMFNMLA
jgi:hypothetical protein